MGQQRKSQYPDLYAAKTVWRYIKGEIKLHHSNNDSAERPRNRTRPSVVLRSHV